MHWLVQARFSPVVVTVAPLLLSAPFAVQALPPADISFVPLSQSKAFRADELMEFYRTDASVKHIKPYTDIIFDSPVYPVRPTSPVPVLWLHDVWSCAYGRVRVILCAWVSCSRIRFLGDLRQPPCAAVPPANHQRRALQGWHRFF